MIVCYSSCRCCKDLLISSLKSIEKNNQNVTFFIFNNKIKHFSEVSFSDKSFSEEQSEKTENTQCQLTDEYEYSKEDLKEIKSHCKRLVVVNIDPWMDIFNECHPLKTQTNTYTRLLMSRFFQKFSKKSKILPFNHPDAESFSRLTSNPFGHLETFPDRFIYCDEDTICNGNIEKFWKHDFSSDILGFVEQNRRFCSEARRRSNIPRFYKDDLYICAGLLIFKTSFDLLKAIQPINIIIISKIIGDVPICRDQSIINMMDHDVIGFELVRKMVYSGKRYKLTFNNITYLREFHIIHHYKSGFIKKYANRFNIEF